MPNIEKAYHILAAAASDSIDLLKHGNVWETRELLQSALLRAEEEAIKDDNPDGRGLFSTEFFRYPLPLGSAFGSRKSATVK